MSKTLTSTKTGVPDFATIGQFQESVLRSNSTLHFTGSLVQDGTESEDIGGLLSNRITIVRLSLQARQRLIYSLSLFGADTFTQADLDKDYLLGAVKFDLTKYGSQLIALGATAYESYNGNSQEGHAFGPGAPWLAMTFTPQADHTLTAVEIKSYRDAGATGRCYVQIREVDVGTQLPTASILATGTADIDNWTTSNAGAYNQITLDSPVRLLGDTMYAYVIYAEPTAGVRV